MDKINRSTNKNFGIVFFIVFLIIAFYPVFNNKSIYTWSLIISFVFLFLGLKYSVLLTPFNALWFQFGLFLGKFVSPIIMGIVYFFVIFPTFILLKIFKRNYLNIKKEKNISSYWLKISNEKKSTMKDQF